MRFFKYLLIGLFFISSAPAQYFEKVENTPPAAGGGDSRSVNWIDYDNDGDLDLYVTNGPSGGQNNFFYENDGSGSFLQIDTLAITNDSSSSVGSSWGDINNDGLPDLFIATWYNQNNLLYLNKGNKTFELLGQSPVVTDRGYSETGSWGDYNLDGLLDLYVTNSEGKPLNNFLYKNLGAEGFVRVIDDSTANDNTASRSADWADYNLDGHLDLFTANESGRNSFYVNSSGRLIPQRNIPPVTEEKISFGSSWGDYDNDGDFDLFVANFNNQPNDLFRNDNGAFIKITEGPVVSDSGFSIGSAWGDIDNDGDLDLFVTNGFAGKGNRVSNYLYINEGGGTFSSARCIVNEEKGWSYGAAFGDYNRDGYIDLFVARCYNKNENNILYKNIGSGNNWLTLRLEGTESNRSAIGAVIKVKAEIGGREVIQMRQVTGQSGYCGQTLEVYFGLGDAAATGTITIQWPSGKVQIIENVNANQVMDIVESAEGK